VRIDKSGWRHTPWRGKSHPKDLPQRRGMGKPLASSFASGVIELREKSGLHHDLFDAFLSLFPDYSETALSMARHHDDQISPVGDLSCDQTGAFAIPLESATRAASRQDPPTRKSRDIYCRFGRNRSPYSLAWATSR
jgi:hypothetical protein